MCTTYVSAPLDLAKLRVRLVQARQQLLLALLAGLRFRSSLRILLDRAWSRAHVRGQGEGGGGGGGTREGRVRAVVVGRARAG